MSKRTTSQVTQADLNGFVLSLLDLILYNHPELATECSHGPGNGPSGHSYKAFDTFVATNGDGWQLISPAHSLMFCPNCGGDVYTNRCGCGFYVNRKGR